jgi:hypothetical protein
MKRLAGLQVFLGLLAGWFATILAASKKEPTNTAGMVILTTSPEHYLEIALVVTGAIIFCVALVQRAKKTRFSTLQIICGQDIALLSFVLYRYALESSYSYAREIYWLVFVVMAAAVLAVLTGIFQFFKGKTPAQG